MYYVPNGKNIGFAAGNNNGIKIAMELGMKYIVLLNNDTIVEHDFLIALVDYAKTHPEAGIFGGKIYYNKERSKIWAGGGGFIDRYTADTRHYAFRQLDNKENSEPRELEYISGCLFVITL